MQQPAPGQRWISTSEPTLGLGKVEEFDGSIVKVAFPAAEEVRSYAFESAPLIRVRFEMGDSIADSSGNELVVEEVLEEGNLIAYRGGDQLVIEIDLLDTLNFIRPEKRLLAGLADRPRDFEQRMLALAWNSKVRQSPARGFTGARIDLIPHQLAIIAETANRLYPRVMLADEVGLGKTIEACLILHHLHLTGRASRILILVPEALVHQWFVELLRRFNLLFALFDEERCASIVENDPEANPFLDSQLVLCSTSFLSNNEQRAEQARDAGFELLIVDEAHHLEWSPSGASKEYELVESLAYSISSLLLLTATPQQLGPEGHFARLRLLDPDRYSDLDQFVSEADSYAPLAQVVDILKQGERPDNVDSFIAESPRAAKHWEALSKGDESARDPLIRELIDSFGTGRVLFRNTREHLPGFPERQPHLYPLEPGESPYQWLAALLRQLPVEEKVLLITSSPEAAMAVQEKLLEEIHVESSLFHEDMTMLERDRNAAWFAEPEGARILMCSEIGSEGRNFQFAHHLVLFGLPRDPELLEQRIGRLDRIGQTGEIHIHVPYGVASPSELHAKWLHEGLDAFSRPLKGATALAAELLPELDELKDEPADGVKFQAFLKRSRALKDSITEELASGHDRLLELGAPSAEKAEALIESIESADSDVRFERFVIRLFDHLGLDVSDLSAHSYLFDRGQRESEAFADLPEDGLSATFDRETALAREDLAFMTMDHPVFLGALDHYLDSESGNASFAVWKNGKGKAVMLECVFVVELLAPARLHLDRFLPPTVVKVVVDHAGKEVRTVPTTQMLEKGDSRRLVTQEAFRKNIFPPMLESATQQAEDLAKEPLKQARAMAESTLDEEIARLEDLAGRNPQVSPAEIDALKSSRDEIVAAMKSPRVRLDALRLIWCQ